MGSLGITGITTVILIISMMLIGVTIGAIMSDGGSGYNTNDINQITNEVFDEITSYLQIKDQMGKYYNINGENRIQKIGILISPLISQDIDVSQLTIKLCDGETVKIISYEGFSETIESNCLFEHPIWNNISNHSFGFISIHDKDSSLMEYDVINEDTDMAFVIIRLSDDMTMTKGDKLILTLFPSSGIARTIILEAPLPMRSIVTFE